MKKIYIVSSYYNEMYDGEPRSGWETVSYHSTKELADIKVATLYEVSKPNGKYYITEAILDE